MHRVSYWLSAPVFLLPGLLFYLITEGLAFSLGVSPLWLLKVSGGLLLAWGVLLVSASLRPSPVTLGALVTGNLLLAAVLVPAALAGRAGPLTPLLLGVGLYLAALAVLALLSWPRTAPGAEQGSSEREAHV